MGDKKCNGWTNYETWAVSMWIDNDPSMYDYWNERASKIKESFEGEDDGIHDATNFLSAELKERFMQESQHVLAESYQTSLWADLLGAALSEVDWFEIAEHMIEDN